MLGCVYVVFLPTLLNDFRFSPLETQKKTVSTGRPLAKLAICFRIGFQHDNFAVKSLDDTSLDWKKQANGLATHEVNRTCSREPPIHSEC